LAAVEVALVNIYKGKWTRHFVLDNKSVGQITAYLDDAEGIGNPYPLRQNADKSFQGSIVLGKGFILEPHEAASLIEKNPKNKDVLFPYLNGEDLNTNPDQSASRWVINFFNWPLTLMKKEEWDSYDDETRKDILKEGVYAAPGYTGKIATDYPDCLDIIEKLVKPERLQQTGDRGAKYWWQFLRIRGDLYSTIKPLEKVLVSCRVSKYVNHSFIPVGLVYDVATNVVARTAYWEFTLLQNSFQE